MIDDGTFQYGLKMTDRISSTNTGVWVLSARPTITPMPNDGAPSGGIESQAHRRNIGMLTATNRSSPRCGSQRRRSSASSICRTRAGQRHAQGRLRALAEHAVRVQPVPKLKALHAVDQRPLVHKRLRRRRHISRQVAKRHEPVMQEPGGRRMGRPAARSPRTPAGSRATDRRRESRYRASMPRSPR